MLWTTHIDDQAPSRLEKKSIYQKYEGGPFSVERAFFAISNPPLFQQKIIFFLGGDVENIKIHYEIGTQKWHFF